MKLSSFFLPILIFASFRFNAQDTANYNIGKYLKSYFFTELAISGFTFNSYPKSAGMGLHFSLGNRFMFGDQPNRRHGIELRYFRVGLYAFPDQGALFTLPSVAYCNSIITNYRNRIESHIGLHASMIVETFLHSYAGPGLYGGLSWSNMKKTSIGLELLNISDFSFGEKFIDVQTLQLVFRFRPTANWDN